jgi:SPP1 gp7 family putative phage head morphogenesis protein
VTLSVRVPTDPIAVAKARVGDPTKPASFGRIVDGLTRDIKSAARGREVKLTAQTAKLLDQDWSKLSAVSQRRIVDSVARSAERHYVGMENDVRDLLGRYCRDVAKSTRRARHDNVSETIGLSLTTEDREFVGRVAASRAWWVRDYGGRIADQYRDDAAGVIADGAAKGLSDKQVARELAHRVENAAVNQSEPYYRTVANAAMQRARTWSSLQSFREAGIRGYTYVSVLDERTSDICRFLHGREYVVDDAIDLMQRTEDEAARDPEAIASTEPYMRVRRDKETGEQFMSFARGNRTIDVARIDRSAVGARDRIGGYTQMRSDEQMRADGFMFPPVHHL